MSPGAPFSIASEESSVGLPDPDNMEAELLRSERRQLLNVPEMYGLSPGSWMTALPLSHAEFEEL